MLKYLLYVNAGGAVTILGFMGASESIRNLFWLRIALCCFALGLVLVGIVRLILVHKAGSAWNGWKKDVGQYWCGTIGYTELKDSDDERTKSDFWAWFFGYASGGAFITGLILGGISLFTY